MISGVTAEVSCVLSVAPATLTADHRGAAALGHCLGVGAARAADAERRKARRCRQRREESA